MEHKFHDPGSTSYTPFSMSLWVTSLFDLAYRWAKVRSKCGVKPKSGAISLSLSMSGNFGLSPEFPLSAKAHRKS